jgi:hypothetical protein
MLSIFPKSEYPTLHDKLSYISLLHPRTGVPASFLLCTDRLFEIQTIDRGSYQSGSCFVGAHHLYQTSQLRVYSRVDPLLLLLNKFGEVVPQSGPFIDYIDCMNLLIDEKFRDGMTVLIQSLNRDQSVNSAITGHRPFKDRLIENFFDTRQVLDRLLVRLNEEKVLSWLVTKVEKVVAFMDKDGGGIMESAANPKELNKIISLELVKSYLSDAWYEKLASRIGYRTDSLFGLDSPVATQTSVSAGGIKRPAPVAAPTAKKLKEIAVAKTCMKMTSFFKPKGC